MMGIEGVETMQAEHTKVELRVLAQKNWPLLPFMNPAQTVKHPPSKQPQISSCSDLFNWTLSFLEQYKTKSLFPFFH